MANLALITLVGTDSSGQPKTAVVAPVNETEYLAKTYIAGENLIAGDLVTLDADGYAMKAVGGTAIDKVAGMALRKVNKGFGITCLVKGSVYGFDVSALAPMTRLSIASTAGTGGANNGKLDDTVIASGTPALAIVLPLGATEFPPGATKREIDRVLWFDCTAGWVS